MLKRMLPGGWYQRNLELRLDREPFRIDIVTGDPLPRCAKLDRAKERSMETALILRGKLSNSRHIELDEPVPGADGEVEVVLRRVAKTSEPATVDVFELISATTPGMRSKEDIDQQIADERGLWGDR